MILKICLIIYLTLLHIEIFLLFLINKDQEKLIKVQDSMINFLDKENQ